MYRGDLLTIPAVHGPLAASALRWCSVSNATYEDGANLVEAERTVDLLHELLAREPRPSVGVVTFNIKQRRAMLDVIDARRGRDPSFAQLWDDAQAQAIDERPFVKNLDQTQGDERDVIALSLGHAPRQRLHRGVSTGETYVPARFGPLGQKGGERRLNVAVSRAKQECYVVSSFEPSQLSVATSRNEGPKLFKQFIEFAHHLGHGRRAQAERILDLVREAHHSVHVHRRAFPMQSYTPLVTQLALALETEGIPFDLNVGASEFRVPLAILDPQDPTKYTLAVFTDEGRDGLSVFERWVHRPAALELRGWKVLHLTSATWFRQRSEVIDAIAAVVPGARGAANSDTYLRARAEKRTAVATAAVEKRPPRTGALHVADEGVGYERVSDPSPEPPPWALAIEDVFFRAALLHIEKHGTLSEVELVNLVGGPRRARQFARQLDDWKQVTPFSIEVQQVGTTKSYTIR